MNATNARTMGNKFVNILALILLGGLSYVFSIVLFVFGFLITPNGYDPRTALKFGDPSMFLALERNVQDLVIVVLPCALVLAVVLLICGIRMRRATAVMFAIDGLYWITLLGVYATGIMAGIFRTG